MGIFLFCLLSVVTCHLLYLSLVSCLFFLSVVCCNGFLRLLFVNNFCLSPLSVVCYIPRLFSVCLASRPLCLYLVVLCLVVFSCICLFTFFLSFRCVCSVVSVVVFLAPAVFCPLYCFSLLYDELCILSELVSCLTSSKFSSSNGRFAEMFGEP